MSEDRDYRGSSSSAGPGPEGQSAAGASVSSAGGERIPSISLPKGGGAIRGMGEKFGVNPATGTGSLTIPLASSAGRSGLGPQLSLSYDSGSGNGPFGFGWSLSLTAVTRKTDKGLPRYLDGDESDVFLISGAEDLVPVRDGVGSPTRTVHDVAYAIHSYRPRIEGLFARIERWTRIDNGVSHWRSITRDNVTTIFGFDENSRIFDSHDPRRIFSYLISLTFDDKGNATSYEYSIEDSLGVDRAAANEANRKDADRRTQRYIKHIRYGNVQPHFPDWSPAGAETPFPADWHFHIVFDYGDHREESPAPTPDRAWPARPDPFSVFRPGFELRTYRRCHRVLFFHDFHDELEIGTNCLVRSTDFRYSNEVSAADPRNPIYTFMESVTQTGYRRTPGGFEQRSTPPLEFLYSQPEIHQEILTLTDADSRENLPEGLDGTRFRWIDLDSEGLPGILTEQNGGWGYKRNLSPINLVTLPTGAQGARARFGPIEQVASLPAPASLRDGQQLLDLTGGGRLDLVTFEGPMPGYFARTVDQDWETLKTFASLPRLDWSEVNLKFVDLTGDGRADVLITEDDLYTFYRSLGADGFGEAERVFTPWDEERGPRLVFADGTQTVSLADLSGDGLSDIVRVRNGEVCYWPNLGYGRFGAKVTMDNAPRFADEERFDTRRVRFADVDGSGTTDLLYIGDDGVQVCFNRSGNSWATPHRLAVFPDAGTQSAVQVVDLLGNGTACLVWSSPLPAESYASLRYVDLMGSQKPHLLVRTRNNLGAETRLSYAPSTRFYLEDKRAGKPWITRLPFPVHVVEKVESFDHVSKRKFVNTYSYRHGFYDGTEREFRGFGYVEQRDTESFSKFSGKGLFTEQPQIAGEEFHLPPVVTKTWFHTGAWSDRHRISTQYAGEYFTGDPEAVALPDTVLESNIATAHEEREAYRALRGSILRQEVYAEDASPQSAIPYSVSERNYSIRQVQPLSDNRHAVFFVHPRETIDYHYERNVTDPRIGHAVTLEVDDYGNVIESAAIGYARRAPAFPEQALTLVTLTQNDVTNKADKLDWYRIGVPIETRTYEITGATKVAAVFRFSEISTAITAAGEIAYEKKPSAGVIQKRLIEHVRTIYLDDDLRSPLPLGEVKSPTLTYESYKLAFTPGLLTQVFDVRIDDTMMQTEAGYRRSDSNWWLPSGRLLYETEATPRNPFLLPVAFRDPFGNVSTITYDVYNLLVAATLDPLGNEIRAANDYRVLQPARVTDPNGNRSAVRFDELGLVTATAVMGKPDAGEGDTLDHPTTRLEYDLLNWREHRQPNFVHTFAREQHGAADTRWQESFSYSDGSGHEVMKKVQAEPGLAPARDTDGALQHSTAGELIQQMTTPRWVGTGRTVLDNKGNPVKKYEPFFDSIPAFNDERELVELGVTPILRYDPLSRLIRTDNPNGTFSRIEFDPWRQVSYDENDTVRESRWYFDRGSPDPATREPSDPEQRAAWLAAKHANTPTIAHLDTLGRTFLTIADNGAGGPHQTRVELDIESNQRSVIDERDRKVMIYDYDMLGTRIHQASMEAGERWTLSNVAGKPIRGWDSRGHIARYKYDALQRPTHLFVRDGAEEEKLVERLVYGERHPETLALNLRGKLYQHYDGAGVFTQEAYDFKGNVLSSHRRLAKEYKQVVDWSALSSLTEIDSITATAAPMLESETFRAATSYDALNRPVTITTPDRSVIRPEYNEANLLNAVRARLRGASEETNFVTNIDYDAKGRRTLIDYGNGVSTRYEYDALTFRLVSLVTQRDAVVFPGDCPRPPPDGWPGCQVQDLHYTYDPVGNITTIRDDAQQTIFFRNRRVEPSTDYEYDAVYRLIKATGREHLGQTGGALNSPTAPNAWNSFHTVLPHPGDGNAMGNYVEEYNYDQVGNFISVIHRADRGTWTRSYDYQENSLLEPGGAVKSNRLSSSRIGTNGSGGVESYHYDAHGNMVGMPHLVVMEWDYKDRLHVTQQMIREDGGTGERTYYVYDSSGQRVRKVTENSANPGVTPTRKEERIYLGGFEIYRSYNGDIANPSLERETLHIIDYKQRIALVETKIIDAERPPIPNPQPLIRYQFSNHLGSATLELDNTGAVISYEEYFPYGSTSYQAVNSAIEVSPKRYRYTGMERDEESGLSYHTARYYAPWLGRWSSADPLELIDGVNQYRYTRNNPTNSSDPSGTSIGGLLTPQEVIESHVPPEQYSDIQVAWFEGREVTFYDFEEELVTADTCWRGSGSLCDPNVIEHFEEEEAFSEGAARVGAEVATFGMGHTIEALVSGDFENLLEPLVHRVYANPAGMLIPLTQQAHTAVTPGHTHEERIAQRRAQGGLAVMGLVTAANVLASGGAASPGRTSQEIRNPLPRMSERAILQQHARESAVDLLLNPSRVQEHDLLEPGALAAARQGSMIPARFGTAAERLTEVSVRSNPVTAEMFSRGGRPFVGEPDWVSARTNENFDMFTLTQRQIRTHARRQYAPEPLFYVPPPIALLKRWIMGL